MIISIDEWRAKKRGGRAAQAISSIDSDALAALADDLGVLSYLNGCSVTRFGKNIADLEPAETSEMYDSLCAISVFLERSHADAD